MKIALLDHDPGQAERVSQTVTAAGHVCLAYAQASQLLQSLRREECDLLIIHWHPDNALPAVIRWASEPAPGLPLLLIVTPAGAEAAMAALAGGPADYLIKPVRRTELATRLALLLRRAYPGLAALAPPAPLVCGPYRFDLAASQLQRHGSALALTPREFDLALLLFRNLGRPLSRATIEETVWQRDSQADDIPSRTIDTHISRVRSKLRLQREHGFKLSTVYGYGYCLEQLPHHNNE